MVRSFAPESTQRVLALVADYSEAHLTPALHNSCKKLIGQLEKQPDTLLETDSPASWAAAIVHTIGAVNFLFDKANPHYVTELSISEHYGMSILAMSEKSLWIRTVLNIAHFDPEYSTATPIGTFSEDSLVKVDNYIVPMDVLPNKYQEMVRQARSTGQDIVFELAE